jgi:predicted dehydrogenase
MRLGLIGAGRWGARYIATLRGIPACRLARLASQNPASAALVDADCRISRDWQDVASDRSLDGLILAVPASMHRTIACTALAAGIPVLLEKPMTLSVTDAEALVATARARGVLLFVDHTHLHSAAFRALCEEGNRLGALLHTRSMGGNWGPVRADCGVLWDWGPHDVAMAVASFGEPPREADAQRLGRHELPGGSGEALAITLTFAAGRKAHIEVSNIAVGKQRWFEACHEHGTLLYDDVAPAKLQIRRGNAGVLEPISLRAEMPLTAVVREFCAAIRAGSREHPSMEMGLTVVRTLSACEAALARRYDRTEIPTSAWP